MVTNKDIIEAYLSLSCEKGSDLTTVQDIADRVGIKKPSLFSHFKNYEELKQKACEYCMEELSQKEFELNLKSTDTEMLVSSLLYMYMDVFAQKPICCLLSIIEQKKTTDEYYKNLSHRIDLMISSRLTVALDYCNQRSWTNINNTDYASMVISEAIRNKIIKNELPSGELDTLLKAILSLIKEC